MYAYIGRDRGREKVYAAVAENAGIFLYHWKRDWMRIMRVASFTHGKRALCHLQQRLQGSLHELPGLLL